MKIPRRKFIAAASGLLIPKTFDIFVPRLEAQLSVPGWSICTASTQHTQQTNSNPYLLPSLQGWWKLYDGVSASTAVDSSGNSRNGTYNGSVTTSTSGATFAYALGNNVTIPNNTNLFVQPGTISAWVNWTTGHSTYNIWGSAVATADAIAGFAFTSAGVPKLYAINVSSYTSSGGVIPSTTWTHVAVTISGTAVVFYINGAQVGTATTGAVSWQNSYALAIGNDRQDAIYFSGQMKYIAFFNSALTGTQIANLYNYGTP